MKYKIGDKVKIKSLDWYKKTINNPSKLSWIDKQIGFFEGIRCGSRVFTDAMYKFCGKIMTIKEVGITFYLMEEDTIGYEFTDEMIECLALEKGSELPSVVYIPYIIEDSPLIETSTEMCPKIEVPTRYYGEVKYEPKMVSLDDACDKLLDMLFVEDIDGQKKVGTWLYEDVVDFIKDFRKKFEE